MSAHGANGGSSGAGGKEGGAGGAHGPRWYDAQVAGQMVKIWPPGAVEAGLKSAPRLELTLYSQYSSPEAEPRQY